MSQEVFEYFFEPDDLEPFYSRLPRMTLSKPKTSTVPMSAPEENGTQNTSTRVVRDSDSEDELTHRSDSCEAKTTSDHVNFSEEAVEAPPSADAANITPAASKIAQSVERHEPDNNDARPHRVRELLSVHALGQYAFCARSAILAAERGDDQDVDCLLYTSPSPRDRQKSRMPSSA